MRRLGFVALVGVGLLLLLPATLFAAPVTIVDTGNAGPSGPISSLGHPFDQAWLAGEFTTATAYEITSIEGWFEVYDAGPFQVSLYADGGEVPGPLLFSQLSFEAPGGLAWRGVSGLSWVIGAGTYWVSFEAPGAVLNAGVPTNAATVPLGNEATLNRFNGFVWSEFDDLNMAVRILGDDEPAVPEPTGFLLIATGLAGVTQYRRRVKARRGIPRS